MTGKAEDGQEFLIINHSVSSWLGFHDVKMLCKPQVSHPHITISKQEWSSPHMLSFSSEGKETFAQRFSKFTDLVRIASPGLLSCKGGWEKSFWHVSLYRRNWKRPLQRCWRMAAGTQMTMSALELSKYEREEWATHTCDDLLVC